MVSVVIPVLNEERYIERCVRSVQAQTYPPHLVDILIADGDSSDRTRALVLSMAAGDPRIRLIRNPRRTQAAGLNEAIAVARGDVIARLDGHAEMPPTHLTRCVQLLDATGADSVGGTMDAVSETTVGEAVAAATRSPFAVGGARYRYATRAMETDTVWLGCFRRAALERVGPFNERFPPHEDYELNHRIRKTGGRIIFSPDLPVTYWTRATWSALMRQYFRYGRAKVRVAREVPGVVRPYHLVPPAFAVFIIPIVAAACLPTRTGLRLPARAALATYATSCAVFAARERRRCRPAAALLIPAVFPIVHLAWGTGFVAGALEAVPVARLRRR